MASQKSFGTTSRPSRSMYGHRADSGSRQGLAEIVISCATESQSTKDYKKLRIFLKDRLRPHGLMHVLDSEGPVVDTFSLFEAVFTNDHAELEDQQKLELLKETMECLGKSGMVARVKRILKKRKQVSFDTRDRRPQAGRSGEPCTASGSSRQSRPGLKSSFLKVKDGIGHDWRPLATALGFEEAELERIEYGQRDLSLQCHCMLTKWSRKSGAEATISRLIQALYEIERRDLAESLEDSANTSTEFKSHLGHGHQPFQQQEVTVKAQRESCHSTRSQESSLLPNQCSSGPSQGIHPSSEQSSEGLQFQACLPTNEHVERDGLDTTTPLRRPSGPNPVLCTSTVYKVFANNCSINHLAIVAVGRTGVGKTTSMNMMLGTMTDNSVIGTVGKGRSETKFSTTWTRVHSFESTQYKLSFIDTPGLGDNSAGDDALTDNQVYERICWATEPIKKEPKSQIMLVYFSSGPEGLDAKEVESIKGLEAATGIPLHSVVLTKARASIPNASLDWEGSKQEVKKELSDIEEEFRRDFFLKHIQDEDLKHLSEIEQQQVMDKKVNDEIQPDNDGLPTRERTQEEFVQILNRKQHLEQKKLWFQEQFDRPDELPVMQLENRKSQQTDSCGVRQLFKEWVELLGANSFVLVYMTDEQIVAHRNCKSFFQNHETPLTISISMPIPVDASGDAARNARKTVKRDLLKKLWQMFVKLLKIFSFSFSCTPNEES